MLEVHSICRQITIGKQGENLARLFYFNEVEGWIEKFGEGTFELLHQRNGDNAPYPIKLEVEDGKVCWKITAADTAKVGKGECELRYIVNDTIVKLEPYTTIVEDAMGDDSANAPAAQQAWVDEVLSESAELKKLYKDITTADGDIIVNSSVQSVNGQVGDVIIDIPTKTSELENDSGFITKEDIPDVDVEVPTKLSELENDSGFVTESFVKNEIANAQLSGEGTDINLSGFATKDDLTNKVDKVAGKSLVDDTEIARLKNVKNYDDTEIKQDLVDISQDLDNKANKNDIPDISGKQDTLVSGTNIKTINGESILGNGNIVIEGGSGGGSIVASSNPIGTIIPFMGTTPPKDYLICDGTVLNIVDYSNLAEHFEKQFGSKNHFGGDGVTTFAIPDLRNEFLRGYHCGGGEQLSGEIGIHQEGTSHTRMLINGGSNYLIFYGDEVVSAENADKGITLSDKGHKMTATSYSASAPSASAYTARPTNVAVLFCIKYTESMNGSSDSVKNVLFEGEWTTKGELSPVNTLNDSIYNYDVVYVTTFQRKDEVGATYTRIMTFAVMPDLIQKNYTGSVGNTLWTIGCSSANSLGYAMEGNFGDGTQLAISTLTTQSSASSRLHGICKVVGIKY